MAALQENVRAEVDVEKIKLGLLRVMVNKEDPDAKGHDDSTLRGFLRARDLNVESAAALFLKFLRWRMAFVPTGSISLSEIAHQIAKGRMFLQGFDENGRPICVVIGARHTCFDRDMLFGLYDGQDMLQEKFVVIGDPKGWGYSHCDIQAYLAALEMMQNHYPERLGKVYLLHAPYIFWTVWKIVYPFMDKNTRKKIVFVENKRLKETLLEDLDEAQLPELYGGALPLVPIHQA